MEHSEIMSLWKAYDQKLEQALSLNRTTVQEVLKLKTKAVLSGMTTAKILTLIVGCVWVILGGIIVANLFVHAYDKVGPFFLFSAAIQLILTAIAVLIYVYQLVVIQVIDMSDSVLNTQRKLSWLKSSSLWCARFLFLQLPVWTTFYLSGSTILSGDMSYILINGTITLLFAAVSGWLFVNINYSNRNKKWFKFIFEGREWTPIIDSIGFYKEIERYSEENQPEKGAQ